MTLTEANRPILRKISLYYVQGLQIKLTCHGETIGTREQPLQKFGWIGNKT